METVSLYTNDEFAEGCALAQHLANHLLPSKQDGGTYDPRTNGFPVFHDEMTYLVSVPGYEYRLSGIPSAESLIDWLKRVRKLLTGKQHFLGWWRDGDEWVFDISLALNGSRAFILGIAESWGQQAVYHPASNEVLYVASQLERAA
jgi:hypothetical protein